MKPDPPQSTPESSIANVVEIMMSEDTEAVVIVEESRSVGIITEKDILRRVVKTAGDLVETQRRASAGAMKWHRCESPEAEIVVVNSYMRENEPFLGLWPAVNSVTQDGTVVLIAMDPDGDINHWLFNHHGKYTGSSLWSGKARQLAKGARLIIHGPRYRSLEMRLGTPETTTWIKDWDEVIEELEKHHGPGSRVVVLPDGTSGIPEKAMGS